MVHLARAGSSETCAGVLVVAFGSCGFEATYREATCIHHHRGRFCNFICGGVKKHSFKDKASRMQNCYTFVLVLRAVEGSRCRRNNPPPVDKPTRKTTGRLCGFAGP
jgi:hypothetical protein